MINNNAKLRASVTQTSSNVEPILTLAHNGESYTASDITFVMDYVGPTGRISKEGLLRQVTTDDFRKIIDENLECRIQKADNGTLILHYIEQPE